MRARRSAAHGVTGAALAFLGRIALPGCAIDPTHANRFVLVHKDGYAIGPDREPLLRTEPQKAAPVEAFKTVWGNRILEGLDEEFARAHREGRPLRVKLLLFVHGGMNTYAHGTKRVAEILDAVGTGKYRNNLTDEWERAWALPGYYPLFINWNSDLWDSIYDDVAEIRFGERRSLLLGLPTAPVVLASRLIQGIFSLPSSMTLELQSGGQGVDIEPDDTLWKGCRPTLSARVGNAWRAWNLAGFLAFYPTRLVSAPVIQGFGAPAWDMMKRRADLVMGPRKSLTQAAEQQLGGGRLLLEILRERIPEENRWKWFRDGPAEPWIETDLEITLVAHSMGVLVLDRVLEAYSDVYFHRIVYLGPAASLNDVQGAVWPYLRRHPSAAFWSFSLAETNEALEPVDELDVVSRGSLLVWIDNFFQRINSPGDKTFGRARNIRTYLEVPDDLRQGTSGQADAGERARVVLVKFGRSDRDPRHHEHLATVGILDRALQMVGSQSCEVRPVSGP